MHASQANRARIAQRAGIRRNPGTVGTDLGARSSTVVQPSGDVRNRKAVRMTAAQRDSQGNRSAWAESPYYFTDPAWAYTVSGNKR